MISDTYLIKSTGEGREELLDDVQRVSEYCRMPKKTALHLRLLAEELTGLMNSIAGDYDASFHIETGDSAVKLFLTSEIILDSKMRRQLKSVSSTGKNAAAKGIMGRIREAFIECMDSCTEAGQSVCGPGMMNCAMMMNPDLCSPMMWSLSQYRTDIQITKNDENKEEWDELEKSIIANIADDVTVGISNKKAEIIVTMKWKA